MKPVVHFVTASCGKLIRPWRYTSNWRKVTCPDCKAGK